MKGNNKLVVKVFISPKNQNELPILIEGLKKLAKLDACIRITAFEENDFIIACPNELYIQKCINDLKTLIEIDFKISDLMVSLRETVLAVSNQVCLAKSPNKHTRFYVTAEPLHQELVEKMETGKIVPLIDGDGRNDVLVTECYWNMDYTQQIWQCGPLNEDTNVLVNATKGITYINEIKDNINESFQRVVLEGVICNEPLRGIRFNLCDITSHGDSKLRGNGQISGAMKRVLYAAMLTAQPAIMEPIYVIEIHVHDTFADDIRNYLNHGRGSVIGEQKLIEDMIIIKGYLSVRSSFGFDTYIKKQENKITTYQMSFSHWQIVEGNVLDKDSEAGKLVYEVRKMKGLSEYIPPLNVYLDKL